MTRSKRGRWGLWFGLLALLGFFAVIYLFSLYPRIAAGGTGIVREVTVPRGLGPKGLANLLHSAGVISGPTRFALWLRATGGLSVVKAGRFELRDDMTPREILGSLSDPIPERGTRITIPEGFTISRTSSLLQYHGLLDDEEFIRAATDPDLLRELGIPGPSAEGYLFPDTYFLDPSLESREVIRLMNDNFKRHLEDLKISSDDGLADLVILASIVQAETGVADEMPTIAGVYINRLSSSEFQTRLLQADPTVSYGCEPVVKPQSASCATYKGILGRRQLDDDTNPYNTYKHPGLPPGPICAPGERALEAAYRPAKVPFFYFVASKGGRHVFSKTLEDHQEAVSRFRSSRP